jgi:tight adherence protein B
VLLRLVSYVSCFGFVVLLTYVVVQLVRSYRQRFLVQAEERLDALYLGVAPERMWLMVLLGTVAGALVMALLSGFRLVMIALGGVGGFFAPRFYLRWLEQQRLGKFDGQLVDAMTLVANSLKSGMNMVQAFEMVTREMGPPIRQEFAYALQENRVGKSITQAFEDMKGRVPSQDLALTINAMNIAQETGGVLSEVFLRIADTIRERNRIRRRIDTLTAQGRLQGIVMSLLPWAMGGVLYMMDHSMMKPMFGTLPGQIVLGVIVVLEILGWLVIRKIVNIDI